MWLFNLEWFLTYVTLNNLYEIGIIAINSPKTGPNFTTETFQTWRKISEWDKEFDNRWDRISMFLYVPSIANLIDCVIFVTMGFSHLSRLPMLNTLVTISVKYLLIERLCTDVWWANTKRIVILLLIVPVSEYNSVKKAIYFESSGGIETSRLFCCLNILSNDLISVWCSGSF